MKVVPRPIGVTLVGILIVIVGVLTVIGAVLGLFNADMRVGATLVTLILLLVIGLIYIAVAKGIFDGNNFARFLVAIVSLVGLLVGLFHLIFVADLRINGLVQVVFELIILGLLFSRKASIYFAVE